jgi:DNA-binding NtrC family response regulator
MQLVIVRRSRLVAFGLLSQAFADEADVRLIWDRRGQDRRRHAALARDGERRRQERRGDRSASWGDRDYMVITQRADHVIIDVERQSTLSAQAQSAVRMAGRDVRQDLEAAARSDVNVLITGGDPVSREFMARRIHGRSDRQDRPFVVLDRRAAADMFGRATLERTCVGTLMFEEVADLSMEQQTELLSYLERRAVRADGIHTDAPSAPRIITASHHLLFDRIASSGFRPDLFYRLNLIHVVFPLGTVRSPELPA